ncbi:MAG: DUF4351 domain-containing protein [Scytonematopsis contorta HA4267-MV1]|jgi:hypothetical protein|nr:DUF4351 domain-containing protein [Scytonematopsis contorta HA4267-MV1]
MTDNIQYADYDSPWKEVLEAYFPQAIQFFFPQTAAIIDWERQHEFLDKEFQKIAPNSEQGKRYADKLVKVWLKGGEEVFLLIHVEIQAQKEDGFEERMFEYHLRIYSHFHQPVISLAILCDGNRKWRPNSYSYSYPDTQMNFRFGTVKLLDYQNRWAELEASDNPFATIVMAHLRTLQTKTKPQERKTSKFNLIRRLYEVGLEEKDIRNLYRFIGWVMMLPEGLEEEFWQEFQQFEQERTMRYMTTGERIDYRKGRQEEALNLILRLLQKRVGELPESLKSQIQSLNLTQLESLGEALLDFTGIEGLQTWLQANQPE